MKTSRIGHESQKGFLEFRTHKSHLAFPSKAHSLELVEISNIKENPFSEPIFSFSDQSEVAQLTKALAHEKKGLQKLKESWLKLKEELTATKASLIILQQAERESDDPHLRLIGSLERPAVDRLLPLLISKGGINVNYQDLDIDEMELLIEWMRLGKVTYNKGIFQLSDDGRNTLNNLGLGKESEL